ncbi:MAG: PAS domain S-box protein [Janthinobacterium lividum]
MSNPPVPDNEKERLSSLRRYAILDTPPEAAIDRIAALAARLFDMPLALVSFLSEDRQWHKACQGSHRESFAREIPRDIAFCAYTILTSEVLVVEDARLDPRFSGNPLVTGELGVCFYAGAPLIMADGTALGSLFLLDFQPRSFTAPQCQSLKDLAASVVSELELRRAQSASAQSEGLYRQMFDDNPQPMWVYDNEDWRFLAVNDTAVAHLGYSSVEFLSMTLFDIRLVEDAEALLQTLQSRPHGTRFDGLHRCLKKDGSLVWMEIASHSVEFEGHQARLAVAVDVTERKAAEDARQKSEQRYALHIQQTPLAVIDIEPDMTVTTWNPAAERTFGYTSAEVVGRNVAELIVPKEEQIHIDQLRVGILTGTGGTRSTNRNRTKSGEIILCEWYNTPLTDETGQIIGIASLARDITEEANAQERLRRSEAHKAAIVETAMECIISIDTKGLVTDWNPASTQTFGYTRAEAVGQNVAELIMPQEMRAVYYENMAHYFATGEGSILNQRLEMTALHRDGREFPVDLTATAVEIEGTPGFTAYIREITERKSLELEREELLAQTEWLLADALERADHDSLTGLLNHRAFHKRLQEELETVPLTGHTGAVLLIDLDNFKFFNDAHGHLAGDDVLRQIALAFGATCRVQDTLARFGGDEFAVLLPGAGTADAQDLVEALREAASLVGYHPPGYETVIPFSLSIGIAYFPEDTRTRTALLETADARLRVSKSGGDADSHALRVRRSLARSVGGFTMLDALVTSVDNKDRYTRRHSEDVMHYSMQIAQALGLDSAVLRVIEIAALLHDVGKIGVPDAILRKPGRLTEEDYEAIKQHPMMGSIIVSAVPGFEETLDAVRHHHERWDGEGYPFGLRGEETPLPARLMAVADAYSAMTTDRPYRKGMDPQKALCILEEGAGSQWDPLCVNAFLQVRCRNETDSWA